MGSDRRGNLVCQLPQLAELGPNAGVVVQDALAALHHVIPDPGTVGHQCGVITFSGTFGGGELDRMGDFGWVGLAHGGNPEWGKSLYRIPLWLVSRESDAKRHSSGVIHSIDADSPGRLA
jgi:hypothetical protein